MVPWVSSDTGPASSSPATDTSTGSPRNASAAEQISPCRHWAGVRPRHWLGGSLEAGNRWRSTPVHCRVASIPAQPSPRPPRPRTGPGCPDGPRLWPVTRADPGEVRARRPHALESGFETPDLAAIPAGESLTMVLVRATEALRMVVQRHAQSTVVLVGHDSINRVILLHCLGLPLSNYWRLRQDPCCINEIEIDGGVRNIGRINESAHLLEVVDGS